MPTDCTADFFGFAAGRDVVASFDGGIASDAGGLVAKGDHLDDEQTSKRQCAGIVDCDGVGTKQECRDMRCLALIGTDHIADGSRDRIPVACIPQRV